MVGMSHVIVHVALCSAAARAKPAADLALHVQAAYRIGGSPVDKVFHVDRGDDPEVIVEFDLPRGVYRLRLDAPKFDCAASDFVDVIADHDRTLHETLAAGPPAPAEPVVLLEGAAPLSFQYAKPTFVLFDPTQTCNQPVQTPLPSHIDVENERDAYYVWLHFDPALQARKPVVAMRFRTPTGLFHYIRIPAVVPPAWGGWPTNVIFNVSEDELAELAGEKFDTLLCPKLWETSVSS